MGVIFDAIPELVPSGTFHHLDVLGSLGRGGDESMSVGGLHRAGVVDHPYSQWEISNGLCERQGVAASVALLNQFLDLILGDGSEDATPPRAGEIVGAGRCSWG